MGGGSSRRKMAVATFLRVSTTISPMHAIFVHISPSLKGGDGVGCTRFNKHGIDRMTGLHAENMEHW